MKYGKCFECDSKLTPVWYTEKEYKYSNGCRYLTGRKKRAVSHLICEKCFKNVIVDDSFDGDWY